MEPPPLCLTTQILILLRYKGLVVIGGVVMSVVVWRINSSSPEVQW